MRERNPHDPSVDRVIDASFEAELPPDVERKWRRAMESFRDRPSAPIGFRRSLLWKVSIPATATLILVVLGALLSPAPVGAIVDTVQALREARSLKLTIKEGWKNVATIRWQAPDLIRFDQSRETRWIEGERVTVLYDSSSDLKAWIAIGMLDVQEWHQMVDLHTDPAGFGEWLEDQEAKRSTGWRWGRRVIRYEMGREWDGVPPTVILVNPRTHLPIRIRRYAPTFSDGDLVEVDRTTLSFEWNVKIDLKLMRPSLPEGMNPRVIDGSIPAPEHQVTPGEGVGPIRIGMSREEVVAIWGEPDEVQRDVDLSYFNHAVRMTLDREGVVHSISGELGQSSSRPFKMFRGRTAEGIALGASEADVIEALGEPDSRYDRQAPRNITLNYDRGISFYLSTGWVEEWGDGAHVTAISVDKPR